MKRLRRWAALLRADLRAEWQEFWGEPQGPDTPRWAGNGCWVNGKWYEDA